MIVKYSSPPRKSVGFASAMLLTCATALALAPSSAQAQQTGTVFEVKTFNATTGTEPQTGFQLKDSAGNYYGTTSSGGTYGYGTVYRYTVGPNGGTLVVLHSFNQTSSSENNITDGTAPKAIIFGQDGFIYGICRGGGSGANTPQGGGTFFRLAADGSSFVKLFDFDSNPQADTGQTDYAGKFPSGIQQGADGNFYVVTRDGGAPGNYGTYCRLTVSGNSAVRTQLYTFQSGPGAGTGPEAQIIKASDGNFYGTTESGGASGGTSAEGSIFRATTAGTVVPICNFSGDGAPFGHDTTLIQGSDGALYGVNQSGPGAAPGSVYRCTLDSNFKYLHIFQDVEVDGGEPRGGLTQGSDGKLYGSTFVGFAPDPADLTLGPGSFYNVAIDGSQFTTLAKLQKVDGTPQHPVGNLTEIAPGNFLSITSSGSGSDASLEDLIVTGNSHPPFFAGEAALSNGVYYLSFPSGNYFGYYSYLSDPHYIYHDDLGFEYLFDAADGKSGIYFYDFKSQGFFYSSPSFPFPYLYDFSLNSVVYYYPDPSNAGRYNTNGFRFFYVFNTGQIIVK